MPELDDDSLAGEADSSALLYNMVRARRLIFVRCCLRADPCRCVHCLQAALHFQSQDYRKAASILKALFSNIEPVEESISMHICFLYMDVLLHLSRGNLHS